MMSSACGDLHLGSCVYPRVRVRVRVRVSARSGVEGSGVDGLGLGWAALDLTVGRLRMDRGRREVANCTVKVFHGEGREGGSSRPRLSPRPAKAPGEKGREARERGGSE